MEYVTQLSKSVFIDYGKMLGEGSYATVFKGYRGTPDNTVAIKKLKQNAARMWHNDPNKRLKREVEVLTSISHPNVMKLEEVIEMKNENRDVFLVMEFCSGETLECRTNKKVKGTDHQPSKLLPEIKIYDIFQQLVKAMTYVHEQGMAIGYGRLYAQRPETRKPDAHGGRHPQDLGFWGSQEHREREYGGKLHRQDGESALHASQLRARRGLHKQMRCLVGRAPAL